MNLSIYVPSYTHIDIYIMNNSLSLTFDLQVTAYVQSPSNATSFKPTQISTDIPSDLPRENRSTDPLQAVILKNQTYIFVRSQSKNSQLYWNSFNDSTLRPLNSKWSRVGDDKNNLKYDPFATVNEFLGRIEVFGVFENSDVLHSWQNSESSFEDKWEKLGTIFSPKFDSAPAVHQMGHSDFNGVLSLFVRGEDGIMHHIAQTTCIKSKTPWGPCTWGTFSKLGGSVPSISTDKNPFTVNHNIHRGIEVSKEQYPFHCISHVHEAIIKLYIVHVCTCTCRYLT